MENTDKIEFAKVVNAMAIMKKASITADVIELWWDCFADWSIDDFKIAARRLLKTKTFMPQPNEFEELRKAGRETPGEIFAALRKWLVYSPNGYTLNPTTPRRIANPIQAMGGPNAYANCDVDKLPFLERRFCEHYEQISEASDTREALPQIAFGEDSLKLKSVSGTFKFIGPQQ
jgi:hypothetical protein